MSFFFLKTLRLARAADASAHRSLRACACACACFACSLNDNNLGEEGGQAIGKALEHTPNLKQLW